MTPIQDYIDELQSSTNIRFERLVTICTAVFGDPRVRGSHHIFKMPWAGNPRINIQKLKGGKAKPEQVRDVLLALQKLYTSGLT